MSSLKATQADGYYIPPDYTNSGAYKKQSLNQFNTQNSHKGHNQYLRSNTVRFELPYDGLCLSQSCKGVSKTIKRGTRFNAQKSCVGNYHTTKIWQFEMKCRTCQHVFIIRTNPQERSFDYVSGVKKRVEEFDTVENKSLGVIDTEYGHAIHSFTNGQIDSVRGKAGNDDDNVIDKLQNEIMGKRKAMSEYEAMEMLMERNRSTMYDDSLSNSNLRAGYRIQRKQKKNRVDHAAKLGLGSGILLEDGTGDEDLKLSRFIFNEKKLHSGNHAKTNEVKKFRFIRQGIFRKAGYGRRSFSGKLSNVDSTISQSRRALNSVAATKSSVEKQSYGPSDVIVHQHRKSCGEIKTDFYSRMDPSSMKPKKKDDSEIGLVHAEASLSSLVALAGYESDSE